MNVRILACVALLGAACVNTPADTASGLSTSTTQAPEPKAPESDSGAPADGRARPSVELRADRHRASMREVALSPDGTAALTLDADGSVRLWTEVSDDAVPFELPVREPLWMSLAPTQGGYLAAFVDTSGGSHVGRIAVNDGKATWTAAFEVPPMDPMFELHVLPGGDRILALGVDHRVRLWDSNGKTLAELDEHGVIPWQLRVEHDEAGVHAAVVQFAPVRIQRLDVADDGLKLVGDPHTIAIDQSPNRNDIGMSADGRYATAMQKREPKSGRFEVELIDLTDGTRRMLVAESAERVRPRVYAGADAVLAETGGGTAMRLPLDQAVPWQPDMDRDALTPIQPEVVSIPGSTEDSMAHATVRGGTRALAWNGTLHAHSVAGGASATVSSRSFAPEAVGLDANGGTVAWATKDSVVIEPIDGSTEPRVYSGDGETPELIAFVGDDHWVSLDAKGKVALREREGGDVVESTTIPVSWGVAVAGWRPTATGGSIVVGSTKPSASLEVLVVENGSLGEARTVPLRERAAWPEGGKPRGSESVDWLKAQGLDMGALGLRSFEVVATVPEPGRDRTVIVQFEHGFNMWGGAHMTMIDEGKRVWVHETPSLRSTAWSASGRRFAYANGSAGYVLDAETGAIVHERRWSPKAEP